MKTHVFAIRVGDHVEFRVSPEPLKKLVSKLTKTVEVNTVAFDDYGYATTKKVPRKIVMRQVHFIGGKVVGYAKRTTVALWGFNVPLDTAVVITGSLATNVQDPYWRRVNLK